MTDGPAYPTCPAPSDGGGERVLLAHGEGGRAMRRLLAEEILPRVGSASFAGLADAALLARPNGRLAFTTDGFVVTPLFFPGGDIGRLAVFGTVNDLSVSGARPLAVSLGLIVEEGLPLSVLRAVLESAAAAAHQVGVPIATGDTKVVPRGAVDGLFVHASGVGETCEPVPPGPGSLVPGDVLLVSGPIGRHGTAVICAREDLGFDPPPTSDCASLLPAVEALRSAGIGVRALRDATRGGVSAVLHEWAAASGTTCVLDEARVPVTDAVRGTCELLGLDPVHVANEGTLVAAVPAEEASRAVEVLRTVEVSSKAAVVGAIVARRSEPVLVRRALGREVPLDEPHGAPLPRIC